MHRADALANTGDARHIDYCEAYLRNQPAGPIDPPTLVTGDDLIGHGLRPVCHFAQLLDRIRDVQLDGVVSSKSEALEWLDLLLDPSRERTTSRHTDQSGSDLDDCD